MPVRPLKQNSSLRALNQPQPIRVTLRAGDPSFVQQRRGVVRVEEVRDTWRIDDRWWTESPISRMYHELQLAGGEVVTAYHDLITGEWFAQRPAARDVPKASVQSG